MKKKYRDDIESGKRYIRTPKNKFYSRSEERAKIDAAMKDFLAGGGQVNKKTIYGKYYIYTLRDGDIPFYVGKGSRDRAWTHKEKVLSGHLTNRNRYLTKRIESVIEKGTYRVVIEFRTNNEEYAYKKEMEFISKFRNQGYRLCNKTEGGDGGRFGSKCWDPMYLIK